MRLRRHGAVDGGRNGDGRVKSAHPQWEAWKSLLRAARKSGGYDPRWDDFWVFVADVGERPVEGSRLYRVDTSLPYRPDNVVWKKPISDKSKREDRAEYARAWRMKRPGLARANNLKKNFGMSVADYDAILEKQGGVCAICGKTETNVHAVTRNPMMLAVDHCHGSGAVRGLLCSACNTGLGSFKDDPTLLLAAIAYLRGEA